MSDNRNEKRETVADIVAQIRAAAYIQNADTQESVFRLANRIDAAWKRERAKVEADALAVCGIVEAARTTEKSSAVGNAAAMREALLNIQEYAAAMDVDDGNVLAILDACRDALSAPPRNCDVGTAEEQIKRWEKFCQEHHEYWKQGKSLTAIQRCNCPCHEGNGCNYFIWAQMPYEEQEGGEK